VSKRGDTPNRTFGSILPDPLIRDSPKALISTVSVVEIKMVLCGRRGLRAVMMLDDFLGPWRFEIKPPSLADVDTAYAASLTFGNVFSYVLVEIRNLQLLRKTNNCSETDLHPAISSSRG
jgi:uncharacterized protein with PIN domain